MQVDHIAGRYFVHPRVDVTHEPAYPGDVAEFDIVAWELWRDAKQDARGNWTCDWIEDYDTEAEAVEAARRLAAAEGVAVDAARKAIACIGCGSIFDAYAFGTAFPVCCPSCGEGGSEPLHAAGRSGSWWHDRAVQFPAPHDMEASAVLGDILRAIGARMQEHEQQEADRDAPDAARRRARTRFGEARAIAEIVRRAAAGVKGLDRGQAE